MSQEYVSLRFKVYRDKNGNMTCASNFETGDVCEFYRTYRFGCNETCVFAPDEGYKGRPEDLERRNDGMGTLIPGNYCPLWNRI